MYKKLIATIILVLMLITPVLARIEPVYVHIDQYGMAAADWMALLAVSCAFIDNFGRAWDKKRKDSTFKYNYAYLHITIIASALVGLSVLGMDVVELGLHEMFTAVLLGFGGNLGVKKATKR